MELGLRLCFSIATLGYFSAILVVPDTISMVTAAAICDKPCYSAKSCNENCTCYNGFHGDIGNCSDVDECANNLKDVCLNRGWCHNTHGDFNCTCLAGWKGKHCNQKDDSQAQGSPQCMDGYTGDICDTLKGCGHANGRNISGNLRCICHHGWNHTGGDRLEQPCNTDINECDDSKNCVHGTCQNTNGSYNCLCHDGYVGQTCSHYNTCLTGNICANGGTCVFKTKPEPPDYECKCPSGWQGKDCTELSTKPTTTPTLKPSTTSTTTQKSTTTPITTQKLTSMTTKSTVAPTKTTPKPITTSTTTPTQLSTKPSSTSTTTPDSTTTTTKPTIAPTTTQKPTSAPTITPQPTTATITTLLKTTTITSMKPTTPKPTTTQTTTQKSTITLTIIPKSTTTPKPIRSQPTTTPTASQNLTTTTAGSQGTNIPLVTGLCVGGVAVIGALVMAIVFFYKRLAFPKIAPSLPDTSILTTSGGPTENAFEISETSKTATWEKAQQMV